MFESTKRIVRVGSIAAAAFLTVGSLGSAAQASLLTNGNFEAAGNADSATNTFPGWNETTTATTNQGNVAVRAVTALGGTTSARLTGAGNTIGNLTQNISPMTGPFSLSFDFAAVDPGAAGNANRSLQLLLSGTGGQINLIVIRGSNSSVGSVQLFGTSFNAIVSQADRINYSSSLDTPVMNNITITGTVGGSYTINTNGLESGPVSFYQTGAPSNFNAVTFTTTNSNTLNYVVDNVSLVPEPASAGVLAIAGVTALARRRRVRQ